jgi:hypothetical protein
MEYHVDMNSREDLSPVRDVILGKRDDAKRYSMLRLPSIASAFGRKVIDSVHKWINLGQRAFSITSGTSGSGLLWNSTSATADLTINSADIGKLRPGHVLLLPDSANEIVVVKTVNTVDNTIEVYGRGHGDSAGAAQSTSAFTIKVIGIADVEGSAPSESYFQGGTEKTNYVQTFEDVIVVSREAQLSQWFDGGNFINGILEIKMMEQLRLLNSALIYGLAVNDTTNKVKTMGGIRQYNSVTSNVAGAITIPGFYTALEAHMSAGLYPSAIHGSINAISAIEQLFNAGLTTKSVEIFGGQSVLAIRAMGYEIELHVDQDMKSDEAYIMDYNRCAYGPLEGQGSGDWALYDVYDDGKRVGKQLVGYFTAQFMNGGTTKMYGIS